MAKPPEWWAFMSVNLILFAVSIVLTVASYVAYRQSSKQKSFLLAACGFGLVVLGGLVEPVYEILTPGDYILTWTDLMWVEAGEGILLVGGLGLLFYAITNHESGSSSTEEDPYKFGPKETDD